MSLTRHLAPLSACLLALSAVAGAPRPAAAHDGPEHVIEALTLQMAKEGVSAPLLYRRAVEYRALRQTDRAAGDLRAAVRATPSYLPAQRELCLVLLAQGRNAEALVAIDHALPLVPEGSERAPLLMIRARVHADGGRAAAALADCDRAFRVGDGEVDWYLTRSRLQAGLKKWDDGLAGLRQGIRETGSAVLQVEYVEMLIDAKRFPEALARIEPELKTVRFQSAWRLRRGRAFLGQGETARAHSDLRAAIAEMEPRIRPRTPDLMLLADRGLAYALLGDQVRARRDFETVRSASLGDRWLTHRLEAAL